MLPIEDTPQLGFEISGPSDGATVVRVDGEVVSLLVDEIGDVVDAGAETFAPPPDTLEPTMRSLVVGAHKLDDRLLLVLDVDRAVA